MIAFAEWHRRSQQFLDLAKTRDDYLTMFLAEFGKVRVPTGEGETKQKALEAVLKLAPSELPIIPGYADAREPTRRLLALHRELSRHSTKKDKAYFLSYRDAAKVCGGLSQQAAHTITFALAKLGVIKIVSKGKAGLNSKKAAEFRYLLPQTENPGEEDDEGFEL